MTERLFAAVASTREQAHEACSRAYDVARAEIANGVNVEIMVTPALQPIGIRQRNFLHAVLGQISEQARIAQFGKDGEPTGRTERYVLEVWKEHYRQRFLPDRWESKRVPKWDEASGRMVMAKRATPHRVRISTETLGTRAYAEFTEKVIEHAVVELGVVFVFTRDEQQLRRPSRKEPA